MNNMSCETIFVEPAYPMKVSALLDAVPAIVGFWKPGQQLAGQRPMRTSATAQCCQHDAAKQRHGNGGCTMWTITLTTAL